MGYKLLAGDLAGEVFAVEFQQAVRALDHAEAVRNEAVLQLIAGHQIHQNVRGILVEQRMNSSYASSRTGAFVMKVPS